MRMFRILLFVTFWLGAFSSQAQQVASIDQFAWLTGHWVGEGLGGITEEMWSDPQAGVMIGAFKYMKQERSIFYELFTLIEEEGTVKLRLRHFSPDMTAWEDKDEYSEFPLVSVSDRKAVFEGIEYELIGEDNLQVTAHFEGAESRTELLNFRRVIQDQVAMDQ